jgi:hypothetical protein
MSTNQREDGRRKVVVATALPVGGGILTVMRVIPACIISIGINFAIVELFVFIMLPAAGADSLNVQAKEEKQVLEEPQKEPDLTLDEVGLTGEGQINYNVDNIKDISVPGPVDPTANPGIEGAPEEAPPRSLPPPPGSGGGQGGGARMPLPGEVGTASPWGTPGGMGGLMTPGSFGGRGGSTREKLLNEFGGNALSEAAVGAGLKWLALHQAPDGHWSLNHYREHAREKPLGVPGKTFTCNCQGNCNRSNDIAATAFGLLPFLAAGETHKPSGKKKAEDYSKTVLAGLNYLMNKQDSKGFYGGDMYAHGLATIALCEAYGMTADPLLKNSAQRALNYIEYAQDPNRGGWRYSARSDSDTSVTGWELMALKSGQMAGLSVKRATLDACEKYLNSCEGSKSDRKHGQFGYVPGSAPSPTMTAVGLLCRQYLGVTPRNEALQNGVEYLKKDYPPGTTGNLYYEYYATQVMHHMGGESWQFWNLGPNGKNGIRDTLIKKQDTGADSKHAHQTGSWWNGASDGQGGRIMETSLSLLSLEVYYRHLPLYSREIGTSK